MEFNDVCKRIVNVRSNNGKQKKGLVRFTTRTYMATSFDVLLSLTPARLYQDFFRANLLEVFQFISTYCSSFLCFLIVIVTN